MFRDQGDSPSPNLLDTDDSSNIRVIDYVAYSGLALLCCLILFGLHRFGKQISDQLIISNGLMVMVSIGEYDAWHEVVSKEADVDGIFNDLPLEKDVQNLRDLNNFLNFRMMPDGKKMYWTNDELVNFMQNDVVNALRAGDGTLNYDGLMVCVSGHGIKDHIVTSDYKAIEKTVIHRLISSQYPEIREIPRIFVFDSCNGSGDRELTKMSKRDKAKVARKALKEHCPEEEELMAWAIMESAIVPQELLAFYRKKSDSADVAQILAHPQWFD